MVLSVAFVAGFLPVPGDAMARESCQRLEARLAALSSMAGVSSSGSRVARTIKKQKRALDQMLAQSRRYGCSGFSLRRPHPRCAAVRSSIEAMRDNLADLERRGGGLTNPARTAEKRRIQNELVRRGCTDDRIRVARRRGFDRPFNGFFSNFAIRPDPYERRYNGPYFGSGLYRTVCVRTCDGYFAPVSFTTYSDQFGRDEQVCKAMGHNTETQLFVYRMPHQTLEDAISLNGQAYRDLPNALRYQSEFVEGCMFRRPGAPDNGVRIAGAGETFEEAIAKARAEADTIAARRAAVETSGSDGDTGATATGLADRPDGAAEADTPVRFARTNVRDVFEQPTIDVAKLNSRAVVRADIYPPLPLPRPALTTDAAGSDSLEPAAEGSPPLAAGDYTDADFIGEYFLDRSRFPPLPFKRPDPLDGRQLSSVR